MMVILGTACILIGAFMRVDVDKEYRGKIGNGKKSISDRKLFHDKSSNKGDPKRNQNISLLVVNYQFWVIED